MRIWGVFLSALNLLDLCRSQVITSHFKGESLDSESLQEVETLSAHSALHCSAACGSKLGGLNSCSATRFDKLSNSCVCGRKRRLHWSELGSGSQPGKTYMVSANCNQGPDFALINGGTDDPVDPPLHSYLIPLTREASGLSCEAPPPMLVERNAHILKKNGGSVIACGGTPGWNLLRSDCHKYDPKSAADGWTEEANLSLALSNHATAQLGEKTFWIGPGFDNGIKTQVYSDGVISDTADVPADVRPMHDSCACAVDADQVALTGGSVGGNHQTWFHTYQLSVNAWIQKTVMPKGRSAHACSVVTLSSGDKELVVLGGRYTVNVPTGIYSFNLDEWRDAKGTPPVDDSGEQYLMARTLTHGSTFLAFLFKSEAIYEYEPEEESYIKINATQSSKRRIFGLVGMKIEELVCNI